MVYTLNIYHFRTINMYETFHIVCVIFITWAQKENLRKLITIYLIVFLYVQTYWIYLGEIGSHQDIFHFTKIKSISPRFFRFHQESADFTKWEFHQESHQVRLTPCWVAEAAKRRNPTDKNLYTTDLVPINFWTHDHLSGNPDRYPM